MIDPLTLWVGTAIVGGALSTSRPRWEQEIRNMQLYSVPHVSKHLTVTPEWGSRQAVMTGWTVAQSPSLVVDGRADLHAELIEYSRLPDNWDGEGASSPSEASMAAAQYFLRSVPATIPLPRSMLSKEGAIEFYWDLQTGYADISFDENGTGSFFKKLKDGSESFTDDLAKDDINSMWFVAAFAGLQTEDARDDNRFALAA